MKDALFESFFLGGFECSTHRTRGGRRLDLIAATRHDEHAAADYARLREHGILATRDGIRWHVIEESPGRYNFSSVLPMLRSARDAGVQVVWDVCHYGWPDDLDIFSTDFVRRYARFAGAFAATLRDETDAPPLISPINEISFFSWAGGEVGYFYPYAEDRGNELKEQLVRAAIEGMEAILKVIPQARFVHADPLINVAADPAKPEQRQAAEDYRRAQFAAWDMLAGRTCPHLGGAEKYLDIIGVNFYPHNQWLFDTLPYNPQNAIGRSHPLYRPFREMLLEVYGRYGRPLFVAETGAEGESRAGWLRYVCDEVRAALDAGVQVEGVCLYPIVNHPGWDDDRHCHNGLWDYPDERGGRTIYRPLAEELLRQTRRFARTRSGASAQGCETLKHDGSNS